VHERRISTTQTLLTQIRSAQSVESTGSDALERTQGRRIQSTLSRSSFVHPRDSIYTTAPDEVTRTIAARIIPGSSWASLPGKGGGSEIWSDRWDGLLLLLSLERADDGDVDHVNLRPRPPNGDGLN